MKLISLIVPSKKDFDNEVHNIIQSPSYYHLKNGYSDFFNKIKNGITQWIMKLLNKIFNNADIAAANSEKLSLLFIILGILVIVVIIIVIVVKVNKTFERKRKVKEILGEKINENTTPNSLRKKALSFSENGDIRKAIRYDFIALLLLMHDNNVIYLEETKTNDEIYKFLRKNKFYLLDNFKFIIDSFNLTWYGHKEYEEESYKYWSSNINLIWNEVTKHED